MLRHNGGITRLNLTLPHQAFNEELDGMFQDANLPETEAWNAMVEDLRKTKDERNTLTKENR